ncbi:phage BR0599 family protein [Paracoccus yeei]|uniref:phage BR0599 family protein n=1 Tax=Paracoccus yeei TaxID=147645 RepID=UPI00174A0915|nr:phage BR0599 family protein [Paracoccus yeei]
MPDFDENNDLTETGDQCFVVVVTGNGEAFRYTNSDAPLEDDQGNAYEPVPLKVGELSADGAMGGGEVDVTLPRYVSLTSRLMPDPTRTVYNVQLRRVLHQDGVITASRIAFTGVVKTGVGSGDEGELLVLKCSTQMYKLERNALRRRYQHSCPHVLYGTQCRAAKAISALPATIEAWFVPSEGQAVLTFSPDSEEEPFSLRGMSIGSPEGREFFKGLTFTFRGTEYEATKVTDNYAGDGIRFAVQVRTDMRSALMTAILAASPQDRICTVYPSCDHTLQVCTKVHRNAPNFGGMPWIPFKNPVGTSFVG